MQIVIFGIVSTVGVLLLRQYNTDVALLLGIGSGIIIVLSVVDELFDVVYTFYSLAETTGLDRSLFSGLIKIIGIGYLTEFSANLCSDANNKSVGDKILFAGKIMIMLSSLPILTSLIQVIVEMLP